MAIAQENIKGLTLHLDRKEAADLEALLSRVQWSELFGFGTLYDTYEAVTDIADRGGFIRHTHITRAPEEGWVNDREE
jgi:hypothetical protein